MARYLIAVSVGPVQDFIAAARKTRDLWFGSHVLSEISRAAAKSIETSGKLIFPESSGAENIANVILAEVETDNPAAVATAARGKATQAWWSMANQVLADPKIAEKVDIERWESQVKGVVEYFAAWVPWPEGGPYKKQRKRVMQLLAARKACRDFDASNESRMRVEKSSLDGARETVLLKGEKGDAASKKLRLNPGEQLDVVGLTKRHGGERKFYPSVARIAADPWLRGLSENDRAELIVACKSVTDGVITPVNAPQFKAFPFDGTVIYAGRHRELREEAGNEELKLPDIGSWHRSAGEPSPYLAILVADGDGMGALIDGKEIEGHRELSKKLASFAGQAKGVVEKYSGALVYAGGDDVVALVPADTVLACAVELRGQFLASGATLSVGIGIGHFMEPLEDLLEYAREAERDAKGKALDDPQKRGDGLAIHLHPRGGAPARIRGQWESGFPERVQRLVALYADDGLADKAGYDLEVLARKYDGLAPNTEWIAKAIPGEAAFVLGRKLGAANATETGKLLEGTTSAGHLREIATELIVARRLAKAVLESRGRAENSGVAA